MTFYILTFLSFLTKYQFVYILVYLFIFLKLRNFIFIAIDMYSCCNPMFLPRNFNFPMVSVMPLDLAIELHYNFVTCLQNAFVFSLPFFPLHVYLSAIWQTFQV